MVSNNVSACPNCGGGLKYYDSVSRIVRTKGGASDYIKIRRLRCADCSGVHREIPDSIFPYKQYEAEVIRGVLSGLITSDAFGYEDFPCEMTMVRWLREKYISGDGRR